MLMSSLYAMKMFMLSLYVDVNVINAYNAHVHVIIVYKADVMSPFYVCYAVIHVIIGSC